MDIKNKVHEIKNNIIIIYIAIKKKETPLIAKIMSLCTIAYALSPIDLIPDFIPILGYLDDIIILPIMIIITIKLIPHNIYENCIIEANNLADKKLIKKWYYSIPIILIWIFILFYLLTITNKKISLF